jgi:hypothetical protein
LREVQLAPKILTKLFSSLAISFLFIGEVKAAAPTINQGPCSDCYVIHTVQIGGPNYEGLANIIQFVMTSFGEPMYCAYKTNSAKWTRNPAISVSYGILSNQMVPAREFWYKTLASINSPEWYFDFLPDSFERYANEVDWNSVKDFHTQMNGGCNF